jgi:lysophospholipase L1-like esterase
LSGVVRQGLLRSTVAVGVVTLAVAAAACGDDGGDGDGAPASTTTSPSTTEGTVDFGSEEEAFSGDDGPTVVVLGDSLINQSRSRLHDLLDPDHRTKIAAYVGEGLGGGAFTTVLGADEPAMQEIAARYAADGADVVVVALGINDAWRPELAADDAVAGLAEIVGRFGSACIVGVEVNPWSEAESYAPAEAAAINAELVRLADVIVPSLTPEQTGEDQIHPTVEGLDVLAAGIADAVRECAT